MTWDEPSDLPDGDLITWEEIDDSSLQDELLEDELAELQVEEQYGSGTPVTSRTLELQATPALGQRARVLRLPGSERVRQALSAVTPGAKGERRKSLRMTIVPAERVGDWVRERDARREEERRSVEAVAEGSEEEEEREADEPSSEEEAVSALTLWNLPHPLTTPARSPQHLPARPSSSRSATSPSASPPASPAHLPAAPCHPAAGSRSRAGA